MKHSKELKLIKVSELVPYANNARTHNDEQITKLRSSLREFGFVNPVLVDKDNNIIAGHGRIMAAKAEGIQEVPCVLVEHLTEAQKKAYILADNRLALDAGWDMELVSLELESLKEMDFDITLTGFEIDEFNLQEDKEIEEDEFDVDKALEEIKEPIAKRGQIYKLGNHRLMCGDSTVKEDVDRLMNGDKADMVFTDPPYGMFLNADYSDMDSKFKGSNGGNKYEQVKGDNEDFKPELITSVLNNFSYCKEIFLWGADYYSELIEEKNNGSWVVWDKRLDDSADKMYGSTFELCWSKARHKRMIARVKWAGIFGMEKEDTKKRCHPTQKPVQLVNWFFDYWSMKDKNIIVDVYGGSGSTLIACEQTNRICYMMELDGKYCDVIIKRWEEYTGNKAELIEG